MNDQKPKNSKKSLDFHDVETQPSPSFFQCKQKDLKIVIDEFCDDHINISPEIVKQPKSEVSYIRKMIKDIKQLSQKPKENFGECKMCHMCQKILDRTFLLHCTILGCFRYFCLRCMAKNFKVSIDSIYSIMKSDIWVCPSCEGKCPCEICTFKISKETQVVSEEQRKEIYTPEGLTKKDLLLEEKSIQFSSVKDTVPQPKEQRRTRSKILTRRALLVDGKGGSTEGQEARNLKCSDNREKKTRLISPKSGSLKKVTKPKLIDKCHICEFHVKFLLEVAMCSRKSCEKKFCLECIRINFQEDFEMKQANSMAWECYSCTEICNCTRCFKKNPRKISSPQRELKPYLSPQNEKSDEREKIRNTRLSKTPEIEQQNNFSKREGSEAHSIDSSKESEEDLNLGHQFILKKRLRQKRLQKQAALKKMLIEDSKALPETQVNPEYIIYDTEKMDQLKAQVHKSFNE